MTNGEFIEATSRLEKYYEKEFSIEQQRIMFEELREVSVEKYKKAITYCIRNSKFLPKIADILNAINEVKTIVAKETTRIECKKCKGVGYVPYYRQIENGGKTLKYLYFAVCECGNEKRYDGTTIKDVEHRSKFYIPLINEIGFKGE